MNNKIKPGARDITAFRRVIRHLTAAWIVASVTTISSAADIYISKNSDGSVRYANYALDKGYVLDLKDDQSTSLTSKAAAKPRHQSQAQANRMETLIQQLAQKHAVDPALVRAIVEVESQFNPKAISSKGAVGAMQLMPMTAARYGVKERTDPAQNIEAGVRYLKDLLTLHGGNIALALASYNAGEGAVARHGRRIPPYQETMLYVAAVLAKLQAARDAAAQ